MRYGSPMRGYRLETLALLCLFTAFPRGQTFKEETRLFGHLFDKYNKFVRPVPDHGDVVSVSIKLILNRLLTVDEKNLETSSVVQLRQAWRDSNLVWNPATYGNITTIIVPADMIWIPEIVLLEPSIGVGRLNRTAAKVRIRSDGTVVWAPPAVFHGMCNIDSTYFPFDAQECTLNFVSSAYDGRQLAIQLAAPESIGLGHFEQNPEWHIFRIVMSQNVSTAHQGHGHEKFVSNGTSDPMGRNIFQHPAVTYRIGLHRMPLFYCIFVIAPCVGISLLTGLVFLLPADSNEKIIFSISVLLAHSFFVLILLEILPASSRGLPIMAAYLLSNMVSITLSITLTVIFLNVHHRGTLSIGSLPRCIQRFLLITAPRCLLLRTLDAEQLENDSLMLTWYGDRDNTREYHLALEELRNSGRLPHHLTEKAMKAVGSGFFIIEHLKDEIREKLEKEKWRHVALTLDRFFLFIFATMSCMTGVFFIGSPWIRHAIWHYLDENAIVATNHDNGASESLHY